ncbi:hypothetical protein AAT19DRAFT_10356 [Rhodotorula toruloides]|uniref:Uncharacterized protein n=1 Tax=Rhodotorula toruloides TaxID=5286 RepID=A0A2T0A0F0_RHOTO|nr:hypothetical protein AAT19DRAFT_10356 [Rhodotorula toruloides]
MGWLAPQSSSSSSIIPLSYFVKEVLRRSRTSCSTLQLALYYLHKSRREIRAAVKRAGESEGEIKRLERELKRGKEEVRAGSRGQEGAYPSPPRSPGHELDAAAGGKEASQPQSLGDRFSALVAAQNSPVLCGRRMFLASLICASKYLQDRNYSNRAWAKISGLDVREINANERAFLKVTGFGLHLPAEEFQRWTERLAALNNSRQGALSRRRRRSLFSFSRSHRTVPVFLSFLFFSSPALDRLLVCTPTHPRRTPVHTLLFLTRKSLLCLYSTILVSLFLLVPPPNLVSTVTRTCRRCNKGSLVHSLRRGACRRPAERLSSSWLRFCCSRLPGRRERQVHMTSFEED